MTQPFCNLVLHYSIARLSWKTIKSLRRPRSSRAKDKGDRDDADITDGELLVVEYEILQGWTLLAFHSMYIATGIESIIRLIVPFYFHLKMIALMVTFVIPSWAAGKTTNGGGLESSEFGLSPAIPFWFDYLIVPGVHKIHELVNHDPKGWAKLHVALLPLLVLDYIVLPGILVAEKERQLIRESRCIEDWYKEPETYNSRNNDNSFVLSSSERPDETRESEEDLKNEELSRPEKQSDVDELQKFISQKENSGPLSTVISEAATKIGEDSKNLSSQKKRLVAKAKKFSIESQNSSLKNRKLETEQSISEAKLSGNASIKSEKTSATSSTRRKARTSSKYDTLPRTDTSTLRRSSRMRSPPPNFASRSAEKSICPSSPAIESQLASSAMKLQEFSREHQCKKNKRFSDKNAIRGVGAKKGTSQNESRTKSSSIRSIRQDKREVAPLRPRSRSSRETKAQSTISSKRLTSTTKLSNTSKTSMVTSKISSRSPTRVPKSNSTRKERLSLGDQFREMVTGNAEISVRDHLFDLDLPSISVPTSGQQNPSASAKKTAKKRAALQQHQPLSKKSPSEKKTNARCAGLSGNKNTRSDSRARRRGIIDSNHKGTKEITTSNVTTRRSARLAKAKG